MSADRHLLFGLLALQCGFISKDQLVAALAVWSGDKQKSIEAIFVGQKALTAHQLALLNQLEEEVLAQHGKSAEQSLAALSSIGSVRQEIECLADAQLNATLVRVAKSPEDTSAFEVKGSGKETRREGALRYRTIRLHAKGGLGEVFVAKDEELNREVALKEIQERFADSDESRARFKLEAEITGNLEHPGIVPVYGLGQYEDGRPYYAMRFIRGDSLKEAIDAFHAKYKSKLTDGEAGLELRKLLRRFVDVCNAMAYAHSRGVLHRDLKPGNIILGKYGETLVVDWGLAKAQGQSEATDASIGPVTPSSGSGATPTIVGSAVGTPAYMSPEQAAGKVNELNAATDVYSLGATLFHLLTGQLPIAGKTPLEIVQKAEKGAIRRPRALRSDVPNALEAVCLEAMAKEPAQRYVSPVALAEDVEKWLADEPVSAYVEPFLVRARRWMRKHPAIVSTSAACVVLGLCAAMVVAYLQSAHAMELAGKNVELTLAKNKAEAAAKAEGIAKLDAQNKQKLAETERTRAEQREQEAIDAVKRFGDAVAKNKDLKDNPKLELLRKELLKEPLVFFKSLRTRLQEDKDTRPESLARLASAAFDLGFLTSEIGDKQDAIRAYQEAIAIRERLAREYPNVTQYAKGLAGTLNNLGTLLSAIGKPAEALATYGEAIKIQERLARENPAVTEYAHDLAGSLSNLGVMLWETGKTTEAIAALEAAKAICGDLARDNPTVTQHLSQLASISCSLGNLQRASGNPASAIAAYEAAIAIQEKLVRENPKVTEFQGALATTHYNHANLLGDTGNHTEALAACEAAIAIRKSLVRDNPSVTEFQSALAHSNNQFGSLLVELGKPAEAIAAYEAAKAIQEKLVRENPRVILFQRDLAASHNNLGDSLGQTGRTTEALAAYEAAMAIQENLVRENPKVTEFQSGLGATLHNMAVLEFDKMDYLKSKALLLAAVKHQKIAIATAPTYPIYRHFLQTHYHILQETAQRLGDADLETEARKGLLQLKRSDPQFALLDKRLEAMARGEVVNDIAELLALGQRAYDLQQYLLALRCYAPALEREPALSEDRQKQVAYNAAGSAALAASGKSLDEPPPDDAAKAKLRTQALGWLKSELAQWEKAMEKTEARPVVAQTLAHWQNNGDLASVRETEEIEKLPEAERKEWESLWARVKEMLDKVSAELKSEGK